MWSTALLSALRGIWLTQMQVLRKGMQAMDWDSPMSMVEVNHHNKWDMNGNEKVLESQKDLWAQSCYEIFILAHQNSITNKNIQLE